jgi:hypothetical protein
LVGELHAPGIGRLQDDGNGCDTSCITWGSRRLQAVLSVGGLSGCHCDLALCTQKEPAIGPRCVISCYSISVYTMGYLKGFAVPKSSGYAAQGRQTVQLTVTDATPLRSRERKCSAATTHASSPPSAHHHTKLPSLERGVQAVSWPTCQARPWPPLCCLACATLPEPGPSHEPRPSRDHGWGTSQFCLQIEGPSAHVHLHGN